VIDSDAVAVEKLEAAPQSTTDVEHEP
jgi:hypothetical protein